MACRVIRSRRNVRKANKEEKMSNVIRLMLENGKRYAHTATSEYHITMASLQPNSSRAPNCACGTISQQNKKASESEDRIVVIIEHDLKEHVLCILDVKKLPQYKLNLVIKPGEQVAFKVLGNCPVLLSGVSNEPH